MLRGFSSSTRASRMFRHEAACLVKAGGHNQVCPGNLCRHHAPQSSWPRAKRGDGNVPHRHRSGAAQPESGRATCVGGLKCARIWTSHATVRWRAAECPSTHVCWTNVDVRSGDPPTKGPGNANADGSALWS